MALGRRGHSPRAVVTPRQTCARDVVTILEHQSPSGADRQQIQGRSNHRQSSLRLHSFLSICLLRNREFGSPGQVRTVAGLVLGLRFGPRRRC